MNILLMAWGVGMGGSATGAAPPATVPMLPLLGVGQ